MNSSQHEGELDTLYSHLQILKVVYKMGKINKHHLIRATKKRIAAIKRLSNERKKS